MEDSVKRYRTRLVFADLGARAAIQYTNSRGQRDVIVLTWLNPVLRLISNARWWIKRHCRGLQ